MIVDATCAPSNIKYPQDTELLNDARKKLETMIDQLHDAKEDGRRPRTYAGKAKKDYLAFARLRKKTSKAAHKTVGKLLRYVRRNLRYVRGLLELGRKLPENLQKQLGTIEQLYEQQKSMFENRSHRVENRIVSLRQPFLRPIVRGKAKAPVEFGPKLDISVINGFVRLEQYSFEAYNESEYLLQEIEHYRSLYGCYPSRVLADKIYRNRKNLSFCKERGIRLSGPALGRPKKDAVVDKKRDYQDICERGEVERDFSLTKRKFGLGLIRTYLKETTTTVLGLAVLAFNLHRVFRKVVHDLLCAFLKNVSMAICFKNLLFGQ